MKYTPSPWNGTRETEFGNSIILSSTGVPICEILFADGLGADSGVRGEAKANELLIRQACAMKEELERALANLKNLKSGKLTIWDFPLDEHIKEMENIVNKTEEQ